MTRESDPSQGLNAAVADVLNGERVAAGMTYDELGEVTGISKRTLMRLMSTKDRHINLDVLDMLAGAFRTTPEHLLASAHERMARPRVEVDPATEEAARRAIREAEAKRKPPPSEAKVRRVRSKG